MNRKHELLAQIAKLQAEADALPDGPREIWGVWDSKGNWYYGLSEAGAKEYCSTRPGYTCRLLREVVPLVVTDEVVERFHAELMSRLFAACQPDRGDVFSFMDDQKELMRAALAAAQGEG